MLNCYRCVWHTLIISIITATFMLSFIVFAITFTFTVVNYALYASYWKWARLSFILMLD